MVFLQIIRINWHFFSILVWLLKLITLIASIAHFSLKQWFHIIKIFIDVCIGNIYIIKLCLQILINLFIFTQKFIESRHWIFAANDGWSFRMHMSVIYQNQQRIIIIIFQLLMSEISHSQFTHHSQSFKALVQIVNTYDLPQLKLHFVNVAKKIADKVDEFHSQYDNLASLLNQTKQGKGKVLLHFACARGNVDIVRYLIEQLKADYQIKDKQGNNMYFTAVAHGNLQLVKYFMEELKVSVSSVKQGQIGPLHVAASTNNDQLIEYLVSKGADLQKISINGKPLNWAVGHGHVAASLKLLQLGADPNGDLTIPQPAPIILAIDFGLQTIYEKLIQKKCSLQVTDPMGFTILHVAAEAGSLRAVKLLIENGMKSSINKQVQGKTPLYLAFEKNHWDVVCFLRDHTNRADEIQQKFKIDEQARKKAELAQITQEDIVQAENLKNKGNTLYSDKKYSQALQQYTKAQKLNPKNDIIYRNMAACYLGLGNYQQALQACKKAKQNGQKNVKTLYRQAQAYVGLKNYVQGASSFWQCVMIQPKNQYFMAEFQKCVAMAKSQHENKTIN